jgi:hypothetical protein
VFGFTVDRVQNFITAPLASGTSGVTSQPLIVFAPPTKLKFAAIYDVVGPWCDGNTPELPWNHVACVPTGVLLFCANHPAGAPAVTVSNPSVNVNGVHDGVGLGVGFTVGVGDAGGVGVGDAGGGVGVGVAHPPPPVVSLSTAADTEPVSPDALSVNVSVHVPFGFVTPANAAVMFVAGELFAVACGPAAVVR